MHRRAPPQPVPHPHPPDRSPGRPGPHRGPSSPTTKRMRLQAVTVSWCRAEERTTSLTREPRWLWNQGSCSRGGGGRGTRQTVAPLLGRGASELAEREPQGNSTGNHINHINENGESCSTSGAGGTRGTELLCNLQRALRRASRAAGSMRPSALLKLPSCAYRVPLTSP